jgi:hypothetical protein
MMPVLSVGDLEIQSARTAGPGAGRMWGGRNQNERPAVAWPRRFQPAKLRNKKSSGLSNS